ncbi:MAG: sigma-70 family RNA polymerase sigma factor [Verrucomicrobiota bacterium]
MEPAAPTDAELLADWLVHRRESAFHALVSRYAALVHLAAKRACDDDSLAAEASQLTFILLARKAKSLGSRTSLGGWLHLTAVGEAKNLLRSSRREARKRELLQTAMDTHAQNHPGEQWKEMQPFLNDALAALSDKDREALLLRFYRSLTIREIAATLGIATDAAQKRIDRATERLRGKLARRGVQAGGSLSAVLLAGFATDSQAAEAALQVSTLTSKALAASAAASSPLTIIAMTTAFKTSSAVPPVIVLILACGWLGVQRHTASELRAEISALRNFDRQIALGVASPARASEDTARSPGRNASATGETGAIDWSYLEARVREALVHVNARSVNDAITDFRARVLAMERDELLATLNHINALDWPDADKNYLADILIVPLAEKDPELALRTFAPRMAADGNVYIRFLQQAMGTWARKDPAKAAEWFDAQVAAGTFEGTGLVKNFNGARNFFENQLIGALVASDTDAAAKRLQAMPERRRDQVFKLLAGLPADETGQLAFVRLIRKEVPEKDQLGMLALQASGLVGRSDFEKGEAYMDRISLPAAERADFRLLLAEKALLVEKFSSFVGFIDKTDIDKMREWLGCHDPASVEDATVKVLLNMINESTRVAYDKPASLAVQYARETGSDAIILRFLEDGASEQDKPEARKLAEKISDPARREEFLKRFQ